MIARRFEPFMTVNCFLSEAEAKPIIDAAIVTLPLHFGKWVENNPNIGILWDGKGTQIGMWMNS